MKKYLCFFLAILMLLSVSGCQSARKYTYETYVNGVTNDGINLPSEWTEEPVEQPETVQDSLTVTFMGQTHTGQYETTVKDTAVSYSRDVYNANGISFSVKSGTDQVVRISYEGTEEYRSKIFEDDVSYEVMEQKARETVASLVDLSQYKPYYDDQTYSWDEEKDGVTYVMTGYFFAYYREVSGLRSSDYVSVKMSSKGDVAAVVIGDLGAFEDFAPTEFPDEEKWQEILISAAREKYETAGVSLVSGEADSLLLTKTKEGTYQILSTVKATVDASRVEGLREAYVEEMTEDGKIPALEAFETSVSLITVLS